MGWGTIPWSTIPWELPAGVVLLALGGDMLVRGAANAARSLGVSSLFIGITLVSLGTSLPEMVTSVEAALLGSPGIAVGNVIGSNISNILLVLGVGAIVYPIAAPRSAIRRNGFMLIAATAVCIAVVHFGRLDRPVGAALVALLLLYFVYSYFRDKRNAPEVQLPGKGGGALSLAGDLMLIISGITAVLIGANWLVMTSIALAREYLVSETIIGLTIVAIGTSLPELITAIIAALRKETAIALGTILGSNIQNILGILGVTAMVSPIYVPREIAALDIWVMTGATLALIVFASSNLRLSRTEGLALLIAYIGYISYLTHLALGPA